MAELRLVAETAPPLSVTFADFHLGPDGQEAEDKGEWAGRLQASLVQLEASTFRNIESTNPFSIAAMGEPLRDFEQRSTVDAGLLADDDIAPYVPVEEAIAQAADHVPDTALEQDFYPPRHVTFVEEEQEMEEEEGNGDRYLSVLDERIQKNWAAPSHWKIRRNPLFSASRPFNFSSTNNARKTTVQRAEVDFGAASPDLTSLFAKPTTTQSIVLGKGTVQERASQSHVLPEDVHFASKDLLCLFLHPTRSLVHRVRRMVAVHAALPSPRNSQGPDVRDGAEFWAPSPALIDDHYPESSHPEIDDHPPMNSDTPPSYQVVVPAEPMALSYAKRARRVDVQALKEHLWAQINGVNNATKNGVGNSDVNGKSQKGSVGDFTELLQKMSISTVNGGDLDEACRVPFGFICLLHLANEHGLELQARREDGHLCILKAAE